MIHNKYYFCIEILILQIFRSHCRVRRFLFVASGAQQQTHRHTGNRNRTDHSATATAKFQKERQNSKQKEHHVSDISSKYRAAGATRILGRAGEEIQEGRQ